MGNYNKYVENKYNVKNYNFNYQNIKVFYPQCNVVHPDVKTRQMKKQKDVSMDLFTGPRLFFSNVHPNVKETSFKNIFIRAGFSIVDMEMPRLRNGRRRGICFLEVNSIESAKRLYKQFKGKLRLLNQDIFIEPAETKE